MNPPRRDSCLAAGAPVNRWGRQKEPGADVAIRPRFTSRTSCAALDAVQLATIRHSTMGGMGGVSVSLRVPLIVSNTVSLSAAGQTGSDGTLLAGLISYSTSEYGLPSVKSGLRDC